MKKILLFSLVAISATLSYGQRKVDLAITMTSPTASSTIRTGVPFSVTFKVTNNGPGIIKTTDTFIYLFGVGNVAYAQTASLVPITANISSGGSANFTVNNLSLTGGSGGPMLFCSYLVLNNRALPDTVKDNVLGGNNSSCVQLKYSGTGIGKIQAGPAVKISAYPNPASSNVSIDFSTASIEKTSVEIFDIQGRVVKTIDNGLTEIGDHSVKVDVSTLAKGVYFYTVIIGNSSSTSKLIIE